MELANDALQVAFLNMRDPALLAVPSIARSPERAWVLANHSGYLVNYAIRNGPDELVRALWSRVPVDMHTFIEDECIRSGNVAMIEFMQTPGKTGLEIQTDDRDTLEHALFHGHCAVIEFQCERRNFEYEHEREKVFEDCAKAGHGGACEIILSRQPGTAVGGGLRLAFDHGHAECVLKILGLIDLQYFNDDNNIDQGPMSRWSDNVFFVADVAVKTASSGLMAVWRAIEHQDFAYATLCAMAYHCVLNGHARLLKIVAKRSLDVFGKPVEFVHDWVTKRPTHAACANGFLRVLKVVESMGHTVNFADLTVAAEYGQHTVVEHLLKGLDVTDRNIEEAMRLCAKKSHSWSSSASAKVSHVKTFEILAKRFRSGDLFDTLRNAIGYGSSDIVDVFCRLDLTRFVEVRRRFFMYAEADQTFKEGLTNDARFRALADVIEFICTCSDCR